MKDNNQTTVNQMKNKRFLDKFTWRSSGLVLFSLFCILIFAGLSGDWFGVLTFMGSITIVSRIFNAIANLSFLPALIIITPIIGVVYQLININKGSNRRDWIVIFMTFLTIILVMFLYPNALNGGVLVEMPNAIGIGLSLRVDMLGFTMLFITSIIWFIVMVYAHEYMKKEQHVNRFLLFMALTYSAVLGTIMSGDLLTMFLFFEIMTITSYMLVTHTQKQKSYEAGYNFIFMGLIGGFSILVALLLIYFNVGNLEFQSAIGALSQLGSLQYWIIGLLIFGFGIKAGMAPVHVWLPRAHPVAPTPASALLSGIMIKVGAFGILRVSTSYFFPAKGTVNSYLDPIWMTTENIGAAMIWLGIVTMAFGVFMALQQTHMKHMLAYSSISQMGYIVVGIGVALYLGYRGAMGYSGALYHIINHALFKSLLFMVAGVVYFHTREQNMYNLGGLWKKLPLTATVCLIAILGISGIPLFNGFISKSILHHSLVEAYTYGHGSFLYAEIIFIIVSAGTACTFIKLYYYVFLRKTKNTYDTLVRSYTSLDTAMVAIAVLIIAIGLNPGYILNQFIIPQLNLLSYDPEFISKYVQGLKFFTLYEFTFTFIIITLATLIFFVAKKYNLFYIKFPGWLKLEYILFYPINFFMRRACKLMYGDQCPIDQGALSMMSLKNNAKVGFLERFVFMTNVFNRRYETNIIKSDAFIYTAFITFVLLFMFVFGVF
jgi:hydrogenase-4 component B